MVNSDTFAYVSLMDKVADASWMRLSVISNNIANGDTPYYKRSDVSFQDILENEITKTKYSSIDNAVKSMDYNDLEPYIYIDADNYSYRLDRNNVDIDTENVELASEQLRYQAITTAINNEFSRFDTVTRAS